MFSLLAWAHVHPARELDLPLGHDKIAKCQHLGCPVATLQIFQVLFATLASIILAVAHDEVLILTASVLLSFGACSLSGGVLASPLILSDRRDSWPSSIYARAQQQWLPLLRSKQRQELCATTILRRRCWLWLASKSYTIRFKYQIVLVWVYLYLFLN